MSAIAVSLESITSHFAGVDEPEKVKRAISYAHENLMTQYVMLVGDAANFPVRFWFLHGHYASDIKDGITPKYPNGDVIECHPMGSYIQSDLYYANLYHHAGDYPHLINGVFDTWDANGNGLYNEAWMDNELPIANPTGGLDTDYNPDNVDGYPDVAVGRIPARNTSDVQKYVAKVIAYETRAAPRNPIFTFVADEPYGVLDTTVSLGAKLAGKMAQVSYLLMENDGAASPAPFSNASPQQIASSAGESAWLSYLGHGGPTVWGAGGVFTASDVAITEDTIGLPVVFAAGCQTTLFMTNTPWGDETSIDVDGVTRGPFVVDSSASPGSAGLVITDTATGQKWGNGTPGCNPLPVPTPAPAALNVPNSCCANPWLFDDAPGGGIAYIGDHCVAPDSYPAEIEGYLLDAYVGSTSVAPVLGDLFLSAQRQYWGGAASQIASTKGLGDYHGIPRLYLGWLLFFCDPSLRLPSIPTASPTVSVQGLGQGVVIQHPGGSETIGRGIGLGGPTIYGKKTP
jgi:hypothetical protein